jgi:HAD superfamily hydrolase (TIGR01509 family)
MISSLPKFQENVVTKQAFNHVFNHYQVLESNLSGVIFDLDNTLVTSSLNFVEIKESLHCPSNVDILEFVDTLPITEQAEAIAKIIDFEMADAHSSQLLEGTREILAVLSSLKLPCAIVTRNCQQAAAVKLVNNNINIALVLTREDYKAKPAPDALLHIADLWQLPPKNLLYVGDYLYDVQAAKNANMHSCLLTFGEKLPYADLATYVAEDLSVLSKAMTMALQQNKV